MKMNKKGFTLIELLAIIVILAIIAVITVPIILNIIDNARSGAAKDSVIGYGKAVELAYTQRQFDEKLGTATDGDTAVMIDYQDVTKPLNVTFDGTSVSCVARVIKDGKLYLGKCTVNNDSSVYYSYESGKAYASTESGYKDDAATLRLIPETASAANNG